MQLVKKLLLWPNLSMMPLHIFFREHMGNFSHLQANVNSVSRRSTGHHLFSSAPMQGQHGARGQGQQAVTKQVNAVGDLIAKEMLRKGTSILGLGENNTMVLGVMSWDKGR
jgi:hypothetical protein